MKKKISLFLIGLCGLLLTGCAQTYHLSEDDEDKIVEYAADLVLSKVEKFDNRLVDLELYKDVPESLPTEESNKMDEVADTPVIDIEKGPVEDHTQGEQNIVSKNTLESVLLPEGFSLQYEYYETLQSYPNTNDSNPVFIYDAADGKKLLVLHFTVVNLSGEMQKININDKTIVMDTIINGKERIRIIPTFLLDDLITFVGDMEAGDSVPVVLIAEVKDDIEISKISLKASIDGEDASFDIP